MPYNDDNKWVYEAEVPQSGDALRRAYTSLLRCIESYLFDYDHPGYSKPEYLSWAMEASKAMHNSSGVVPSDGRWRPSTAGAQRTPESNGKVYDYGVRYHPASFDRPDHDTSPDRPREPYNSDLHNPADQPGETKQTNRYVDPADDPREND